MPAQHDHTQIRFPLFALSIEQSLSRKETLGSSGFTAFRLLSFRLRALSSFELRIILGLGRGSPNFPSLILAISSFGAGERNFKSCALSLVPMSNPLCRKESLKLRRKTGPSLLWLPRPTIKRTARDEEVVLNFKSVPHNLCRFVCGFKCRFRPDAPSSAITPE